MAELLAVDLGLRTGLALYGDDGRLRWYRSQNYGARPRLKRGIYRLLNELDQVTWVVAEGGSLAELWQRESERRGIAMLQIGAETWRSRLLHPSEQRSGADAKQTADRLARQIIDWSGAPRPTSLRHDAAEAIMIGLWAVLHLEWLHEVPSVLLKRT